MFLSLESSSYGNNFSQLIERQLFKLNTRWTHTQAEKVLVTIFESGVLYCVLQVKSLKSSIFLSLTPRSLHMG
jgi:hypothetical protein